MTNQTSGNVPQTIDSAGNVVPKPNGVSRWANPRRYNCGHGGCEIAAVRLDMSTKAHNCCGTHEEGETDDYFLYI